MGQNRWFFPTPEGAPQDLAAMAAVRGGSGLYGGGATSGHLAPRPATTVAGSAPVASSQSVLDALADAETLRLFLDGSPHDPGVSWFSLAGMVADDVWLARWQGARSVVPSDSICTPDLAAACARIAGKAAFRAVPGLRG